MSDDTQWSDTSGLKTIVNPTHEAYETKIEFPELTFLGVQEQPDFASLKMIMYPGEKVIELKSFKHYLYQFRQKVISYERLINVIYDDVMATYAPARLRLTMVCNPRGGMSSTLTIDSDWKARGGTDEFRDWPEQD